jgi:predicted DNA-binding transcriptional regulator AlpA
MATLTHTEQPARRLGNAKAVGRVLDLSWRTVYRLADAGKIPPGMKLGASRRWDLAEIETFIASGCKPPKGVPGRGDCLARSTS